MVTPPQVEHGQEVLAALLLGRTAAEIVLAEQTRREVRD
jgi:hypothetical protein